MENDQYPRTVEKVMKMSNKYGCDNNRQWIDDYGSDQWNNGRANEKNEHRHLQTEEDVEGVSGGGFVWSHCVEKNEVSIMRRERDNSFLEKENEELLNNILQDSSSTIDIIEDDDFVKNVKQSAMNINGVSM